jgi:hypothetical protein
MALALGCSAFLMAGCGGSTTPEKGASVQTPAATSADVTLHVEGMTERQALT